MSNADAYRSSRWNGRTRGGSFGNRFFLEVIRFLGVRVAHAALVPIAAYYLVASPRSVRNSRRYLRRVLGPQPSWKWPFLIYRHFYSLGMTLLDRSAIMMGSSDFECEYEGEEHITGAVKAGKGVVLVGAHVGNWAVGGHLLKRLETGVNIVALENEVKHIQRMFDRAYQSRGFKVLPSSPDLGSSMTIMQALQRGEIVAFNGDRTMEGTPSAEVTFFGDAAVFPTGPYLMASVTGAAVIHVFAMRDRVAKYRFFCSPARTMPRGGGRRRDEAVRNEAQAFAQSLESVLGRYPYQWYNFFPFWKGED